MSLSVSPKGRKFLYVHENVVLKAYRDPVGIWTIGAGLTSASGVVAVKAGMSITTAENDRLVDLALKRNYLPRVTKALGESASQTAIDAGASFDWNTGKILSASWVKSFLAGKSEETRKRLGLWNKAGGRVLRGLTRRRSEEADILLLGKYPAGLDAAPVAISATSLYAVFVVSVTVTEIEQFKADLAKVGFAADAPVGAVLRTAVEAFQKGYDLTIDGKVGRATLATLQREIDARAKSKKGAVATVAGTGVAGGDQVATVATGPAPIDPTAIIPDNSATWLGLAVGAVAVLYLAWQAYQYRDIIAARVSEKTPRLAAWLRSF